MPNGQFNAYGRQGAPKITRWSTCQCMATDHVNGSYLGDEARSWASDIQLYSDKYKLTISYKTESGERRVHILKDRKIDRKNERNSHSNKNSLLPSLLLPFFFFGGGLDK